MRDCAGVTEGLGWAGGAEEGGALTATDGVDGGIDALDSCSWTLAFGVALTLLAGGGGGAIGRGALKATSLPPLEDILNKVSHKNNNNPKSVDDDNDDNRTSGSGPCNFVKFLLSIFVDNLLFSLNLGNFHDSFSWFNFTFFSTERLLWATFCFFFHFLFGHFFHFSC